MTALEERTVALGFDLGSLIGGAVDYLENGSGLFGWFCDLSRPDAVNEVQMTTHGQVIAQTITFRDRPDIDGVVGHQTRAGFIFGWSGFDNASLTALFDQHGNGEVNVVVREYSLDLQWVVPRLTLDTLRKLVAKSPNGDRKRENRRYLNAVDIWQSGAFDASWYARSQGLEGAGEAHALAHYLDVGDAAGAKPCFVFDPAFYANSVGLSGAAGALLHYVRAANPNVSTSIHFDAAWFTAQGGLRPGLSALGSYLAQRRTVSPNPGFDIGKYLAANPDLGDVEDAYEHFVTAGLGEVKTGSVSFEARQGERLADATFFEESIQAFRNNETGFSTLSDNLGEVPEPTGTDLKPAVNLIEQLSVEDYQINPITTQNEVAENYLPTTTNESSKNSYCDLEDLRNEIGYLFDEQFYKNNNPDLLNCSDLFLHFIEHGWREWRDPSEIFSIKYYLENNNDVRIAELNPVLHFVRHGRVEGRKPISYENRVKRRQFQPLISIIVPNYNHSKYLTDRIESIIKQEYTNIELILLDDCSTDDSRSILYFYANKYPNFVRFLPNEANSGNVFKQWKRGISEAKGELIWICESDDFCESNFLTEIVPSFADTRVMIAFGKVQFTNEHGVLIEGLDGYRESVASGIWHSPFVMHAAELFREAFALANIIPNVGGCVIRRQELPDHIWTTAETYKVSGDWYLYSVMTAGGCIAYRPNAIAYFRQHGKNTSVSSFKQPYYYKEHEKIIHHLRQMWGVDDDVAANFYTRLYNHYKYANAYRQIGKLSKHYSNDFVLSAVKNKIHILIAALGFHLGGGEIFPIHLANDMLKRGYIVSFFCLDTDNENIEVKQKLDPAIAVYDAQYVNEIGVSEFIRRAGVDIIHSHNAGVEFFFFHSNSLPLNTPYIVTLHGSYEVTPVEDYILIKFLRGVKHWIYLSEKNLKHLEGLPISREHISFIPNGMPVDQRSSPVTRESLHIEENAKVFALVSRAIPEKGWRVAIEAVILANQKASVPLHLLLCGSGPEVDILRSEYAGVKGVHILGFQSAVSGIYRVSDVAILPTRFAGESYPLTLIEAIQNEKPIIATDIGEIGKMISDNGNTAGILIPFVEDEKTFVGNLFDALLTMCDSEQISIYSDASKEISKRYDIAKVAGEYDDVYRKYIG
jgi:glycosyltransferase involved in cell wall biosynthesis/GT2 family glycosyltransferase